jgi:hypothetical protein
MIARRRGLRWEALCLSLSACALFALSVPRPVSAQACGSGPTWLDEAQPEPFRIGAGATIGVLNLPNLGAGVTLITQFGTALPIDLSLSYFFENGSELSTSERDLGLLPLAVVPWPPGGSRSSFTLTQVNFGMCPAQHQLEPGVLLGCAGVYGGLLTAEGAGFVEPVDTIRVALGLEAYARWRYRLGGPIGLTYSAGLFVPLLRPGFGYVDGNGAFQEQFRVSPVGGRLDVALTYAFE